MFGPLIKKYRSRILLTSLCGVVAAFLSVYLLSIIYKISASSVGKNNNIEVFFLITAVSAGLYFLSARLLTLLSQKILYELRADFVSCIDALELESFEKIGKSKFYSTLFGDLSSVQNAITAMPALFYNGTLIFLSILYMFFISYAYFLVFFGVFSVVLFFIIMIPYRKANDLSLDTRNSAELLTTEFQKLIEGKKDFIFNEHRRATFLQQDFNNVSKNYYEKVIKSNFFWELSDSLLVAGLYFSTGALLVVAVLYPQLTGERYGIFIWLVVYIIGPLIAIVNTAPKLSAGVVALKKINEIGSSIRNEILENSSTEQLHKISEFSHVGFRSLCYSYSSEEGGDFCLGPLDLTIKKGEIVYFVGGNGSGKSTAAKLLSGLYQPTDGVVLMNDEVVTCVKRHRKYFSGVFQDGYLFDTVVHKNGKPIADADIQIMINRFGLDASVSVKNGKFSTALSLSQGQKKRLMLLNSYFEGSDIIIYDEIAAELDPVFRDYFYREYLFSLKKDGKTIIVVTHDDRYYSFADKVYKFERGRCTEASYDAVI